MARISRARYAELYGPTTGDLVRLGDTSLRVEVEADLRTPGDELVAKVGGTIREGQGVASSATHAAGAPDLVIVGALVVDAVVGIVKCDIGVRDGRIVALGHAGNPDVMDGVHPDLVVGPHTAIVPATGMIVTAGAVEAHGHVLLPDQLTHAIATGTTTMITMDWADVLDIAVSPAGVGAFLRAAETSPINLGLLGRGSTHDPDAVVESVAWGCLGVKVHEDLGASPAAVDAALTAADRHDFAVCLHTDSLNESGFLDDTLAAIAGRSIHMFHTEGAGGGHVPDIIRVNGLEHVIPSSTNPTNPYTAMGVEESLPMTMIVHGLSSSLPEDIAFAESRGRAATMAAEDLLHDLGAISIFAADTQGMGRVGENITCCWRLASVMKDRVGRLPEETTAVADNERVKRYLAKLTINPAIANGIGSQVGSVEPGKLADLVIWHPATFGVRPMAVFKAGVPTWSAMGDPSASVVIAAPVLGRPQVGATSRAAAHAGRLFVSLVAAEHGHVSRLGLEREIVVIDEGVRALTKRDMVRNDALPDIAVDPATLVVTADGVALVAEPARSVPLSRRYLLR